MMSFLTSEGGVQRVDAWQPGCWINVVEPGEEEVRFLTGEARVPASFLQDIEDVDERSRLEVEDGWTLLILRVPRRVEDSIPFITVPLGFIVKGDVFVTVCHHRTEMIPDFVSYVNRKGLQVGGAWDLLLRLFLSSSVWYLKYLKQISAQMSEAELELERSIRNEELQRLLKIEKSLVFFITSLQGNDNLLSRMRNLKGRREALDADLLEDVEIEQRQARATARIYSDILSGTMDAYASVISNNLNIVMKRMTSVSVILMLPTLVASVYGMNVPNGLEGNAWGFAVAIAVSAVVAGGGYLFFRWRRWL